MTREEAADLGKLMLAYAEGKAIQIRNEDKEEWRDITWAPQFGGFGTIQYRVKPEPREFWICGIYKFDTIQAAEFEKSASENRIIHVREIIP